MPRQVVFLNPADRRNYLSERCEKLGLKRRLASSAVKLSGDAVGTFTALGFSSKFTDKTGLPARNASTKVPPCFYRQMAGVAQLVRAPVCGTGGRRCEAGHSPHFSRHGSLCGQPVPCGLHAAGVAELVDALDLGSSGENRGGSSPSARTMSMSVASGPERR